MYEMIRFKNHCDIWTIRLLDSWCTFFYRFPWSLWYQGKILQSGRLCLTMRLFWEKNFGGDWEDVGQRSAWMFGCVGKETCKKFFLMIYRLPLMLCVTDISLFWSIFCCPSMISKLVLFVYILSIFIVIRTVMLLIIKFILTSATMYFLQNFKIIFFSYRGLKMFISIEFL